MNKDIKPGEFCWNELITNDVSKCKDFYSALFGWETQDHDFGHMTYTTVKVGDRDVGGMMQIPKNPEQSTPSHWLSYILVEDLDEMVNKAKNLGAIIKQDSMPVGDFGRLAILQDPTGAHIALWQPLKPC